MIEKLFVRTSLSLISVIRLGFEPKTHSLEGCCSIQLSYRTILVLRVQRYCFFFSHANVLGIAQKKCCKFRLFSDFILFFVILKRLM